VAQAAIALKASAAAAMRSARSCKEKPAKKDIKPIQIQQPS
jgi:hypothetical protein